VSEELLLVYAPGNEEGVVLVVAMVRTATWWIAMIDLDQE
jgi:hypothetical protein